MKSIDKTVKILEALVETKGARVSELSELVDMPSSTVHSYLTALKKHGLVRSEGDINKIGLKFLYFSGSVLYDDSVFELIEPKVTSLADKSKERAQFITEQNGKGVYLFAKVVSDDAIKTDVRRGKFVDLHATAAGKAILAHMPKTHVEEIISQHGLPSYTPNTITNKENLFDELLNIRDRGYAINDEERITKQRAIGVPVLDSVNSPVGALSISGPAHRVNMEEIKNNLSELLLGTADEIELTIQYS